MNKIIDFIIILFLFSICFVSMYAIYDVYKVYDDSILGNDIKSYDSIDISKMRENINEDICGWLYIEGTNINYPLLHSDNILEYLDKNYKKYYSESGSIFLDNNNDKDFNDDYTMIYGHNSSINVMFSDIVKFNDPKYFKKHKEGVLYTIDKVFKVSVYSYSIIDSKYNIAYDIANYRNNKNVEIIDYFDKNNINKNDIETSDKKIIGLSTCNNLIKGKRSVLLCVLEDSIGDKPIILKDNNSISIILIIVLIISILLLVILLIKYLKNKKNY